MFDDSMTLPQMRDFVAAHEWTFAKSMPFIPHWYVVLKNCRDVDEFFKACWLIRNYGEVRKFGKRSFIYMDLDGYSYWTMDELIEDTTIINRARNTFYPIKNKNFVYLDEAVSDEYRSTKVRIDTIAGDNLRKRIIERPVLVAKQHQTLPLVIWEGVVEHIDPRRREIFASLKCMTGKFEDHNIELSFDEIDPDDLSLVDIGAVFYLEHYQRNARGGREKAQVLRFRRSSIWRQKTIDWVSAKAQELDAILPKYIEPNYGELE